jgi:hypothetical protein
VALGVGAGGALVDVSTFVAFEYGITRAMGRQDQFRDVSPGTFMFTLNNYDGRFTPNNLASAYAATGTLVAEGMAVCLNLGGRLTAGQVLAIEFPADEANWGHVTITCDDMLGSAGRVSLAGGNLAETIVLASPAIFYYPMNDPVGSLTIADKSGNSQPPLVVQNATGYAVPTFGVAGVPAVPDTQANFAGAARISSAATSTPYTYVYPATYAAGSMGTISFWFTPLSDPAGLQIVWAQDNEIFEVTCGALSSGISVLVGSGSTATSSALTIGVPYFVSITSTVTSSQMTAALYVNGTLQGTSVLTSSQTVPSPGPYNITLAVSGAAATSANIQHFSHTAGPVNETLVTTATTEAGWLAILGQMSAQVLFGTIPTTLSAAPIGAVPTTSVALLDLINGVMKAEQGSVYATTSGTLLAPAQTLQFRPRDRPATPVATFDSAADISAVPAFIRDLTNIVTSVTLTGIGASATATDATIISRAGSANASESLINSNVSDLLGWGQDRMNRGKNTNLRVTAITIDGLTVSAATLAAVLALIPGDRIRVSNLPTATLGFTAWDGWILGVNETHGMDAHTFVLYVAPVLPATAIFDTAVYTGSDNETWQNFVGFAATTAVVVSADGITAMDTVAVPYTILADAEQMTVTAVTALSGGTQTLTLTRAVNGTVAAGHNLGATFDVLPTALYAF